MQIQEVVKMAENDPDLKDKLENDPLTTMRTMASMPLQSDKWIYRGVVFSLGFTVIISVIIGGSLAFYEKAMPDMITALGSAAVGALAGLLAPQPGRG